MRSTADKTCTSRRAQATATVHLSAAALDMLREKKSPKGDALEVAKVAGILAAKHTATLVPYCHPVPVDHVAIEYELGESVVHVTSTVTAVWKTGVEMEALVAVHVASLTLFDMLKMVDPAMRVTDIRVLAKHGGKTSFQERLPARFRAAVVVTSDGTAAGTRQDRSGQIIRHCLAQYGIREVAYHVLPDDRERIRQLLLALCEQACDLVFTTGGTGLGPRDVTVEATRAVIEQEIPGILEAARAHGQQRTPYAMLSRGVAGRRGHTLIINLPGSSGGAAESLQAIFPAILHAYPMMQGGGH